MTSSEQTVDPGQPRWNFNHQCYKSNDDVFFEPGVFSIVVIAHGRPDTTRGCILSTYDAISSHDGEVEWIFVENGQSEQNRQFFFDFPHDRKVTVVQKNYGINEALNQGWALSRGEYVLIHENDWGCQRKVDFLEIAQDIFESNPDVGIIQLRDPRDPKENHGLGKPEYNPWSCGEDQLEAAGIKVWTEETKGGYTYLVSEFPNGFNNNPVIMRKTLYRECGPYPEPIVGADPRHGETVYQKRVADHGCKIAHIAMPLYRHLGHVQTQAR